MTKLGDVVTVDTGKQTPPLVGVVLAEMSWDGVAHMASIPYISAMFAPILDIATHFDEEWGEEWRNEPLYWVRANVPVPMVAYSVYLEDKEKAIKEGDGASFPSWEDIPRIKTTIMPSRNVHNMDNLTA